MVSKKELEDILHKEEVEARWNSIDKKRLNKIEKDRKWYLDYTKKEYQPISYQVKKEIEEWERTAPVFQWYSEMEDVMMKVMLVNVAFWFVVGLIVAKAILL